MFTFFCLSETIISLLPMFNLIVAWACQIPTLTVSPITSKLFVKWKWLSGKQGLGGLMEGLICTHHSQHVSSHMYRHISIADCRIRHQVNKHNPAETEYKSRMESVWGEVGKTHFISCNEAIKHYVSNSSCPLEIKYIRVKGLQQLACHYKKYYMSEVIYKFRKKILKKLYGLKN